VSVNLAQLSDYLLITAVVIYSLAMLAYAGDFAYGRYGNTASMKVQVPRKARELAGVGGRGGGSAEADGAGTHEPPVPPAGAVTGAGETGSAARDGRLSLLLRGAVGLTLLGLAAHLAGVITRGLAAHRPPWGDMYEFVTALSCVTVMFFVALMFRYRVWRLGLFVTGAVVAVASMLFLLRTSRLGEPDTPGALAQLVQRLPDAQTLDRIAYRTTIFGFPVFGFGVIFGAIWAEQAWGRYWGWDPVETWAFITWVVYACFLHARATAGWRGRRAAYIQMVGFACLIFNTLVVQTFVTGLHSYAGLG
jgi:ABC-type transport system involved in cytochrome c biogenesis permease subunit